MLLPALLRFAPPESGFILSAGLLLVVNPVYALIAGIWSGSDLRARWPQPLLVGGLYFLGAWLLLDFGELAFLIYAAAYTVISAAATLVSHFIRRKRHV